MTRGEDAATTANTALAELIDTAEISKHALARRVNALAQDAGDPRSYTQTSVKNWTQRGMVPRDPVPRFIAQALAERLGRPVDLAEIGMSGARRTDDAGLDFHRDTHTTVHNAARCWSTVHRRHLLTGAFALSVCSTPLSRWLAVPVDASHPGSRRVGRQDLDALWEAAAHAQRRDSRYGGGAREASQVDRILRERAIPLLHCSHTGAVGREL